MQNILKYRSALMGLAILWIVLFHSKIVFSNYLIFFRLIQTTGYIGVDIFFLLSGIGLVFSYHKHPYIKQFISKRLMRILPAFWITLSLIACINLIIGEFDASTFVYKLLGLDFILRSQYTTWFIPTIMFCYLIFPLYYYLHSNVI
jgi:peptidoglycan/LPS O-acetylase OafA/YrhL